MIDIFTWSAVVYKCEHFHRERRNLTEACRATRSCPSQQQQGSHSSRLHSTLQEPTHRRRLYCISPECTQTSVSCQHTPPTPPFRPHQFLCVGENLVSRSRRLWYKRVKMYMKCVLHTIFVMWCLCFCLLPHP